MKFLKISVTYFVTLFFFQELQSHVIQSNDQLQRNSKNKGTITGPNKEQDQIRLRLNLNNVVKDRLKPKTFVNPQILTLKHRIGKTPSNDRNEKGKKKSKTQLAVDIKLPMVMQNTKMPTNDVKQIKGFDIIDAPANEFYIEDANTYTSKTNVESQIKKPTSKSRTQEIQSKPLLKEKKGLKQRIANETDYVTKNFTNLKESDLKSNKESDNFLLVPDKIDNIIPTIQLKTDITPHHDNKTKKVTEKQLTTNKTDNEIPIIKLSIENKPVNETSNSSVLSCDKSSKKKSYTRVRDKNMTPIDEVKQTPYSIQPNNSFATTKLDCVDNGTMDLICIKQHNYTEVIERHGGNPSNKLQTTDHKIDYNSLNGCNYPFQHYEELIRNVTHEDPFTPDFTYIQPSYEFPNVDNINTKKWDIKTTATHEKSKSTVDDDNPVTTVKSWYNSEVTIKTSRDNTPDIVKIEPHNINGNAATKDVTHYLKPTYYEEEFTNNNIPTSYKEDITNHNKPTSYKVDLTNHHEPTSYTDVTDHFKPTSHREAITNHYEPTSYKDVTDHYKPTSHRGDVTNHYKPNKVDPVNYDTHYAYNNNHNAFYGSSGAHLINKNNHYANIPEPPSCSYYPCYLYPTYSYSPYGKYI